MTVYAHISNPNFRWLEDLVVLSTDNGLKSLEGVDSIRGIASGRRVGFTPILEAAMKEYVGCSLGTMSGGVLKLKRGNILEAGDGDWIIMDTEGIPRVITGPSMLSGILSTQSRTGISFEYLKEGSVLFIPMLFSGKKPK